MDLRDFLLFILFSGIFFLTFMLIRKVRQFRSGPKEDESGLNEDVRRMMNRDQDEELTNFDDPSPTDQFAETESRKPNA